MKNQPLTFHARLDNHSFQYETGKITKKQKEPEDNASTLPETTRSVRVEHEVGTKRTTELNGLFSQTDIENTTIQQVDSQALITKKSLILDSEEHLSIEDRVKKKILEKVLSQFNVEPHDVKMIPKESFSFSYEQVSQKSLAGYPTDMPNHFSYTEINEHYENIQATFNGKISFELENETIEMDLNLSYSREFFIHNEKAIGVMERNLAEKQLVIDGKGLEEGIKNFNSVSIAFDPITELENTRNQIFFEFFNSWFQSDDIQMNNNLNDFKIYMKNQSQDYVAVGIQKAGSAAFLSTSERVLIST